MNKDNANPAWYLIPINIEPSSEVKKKIGKFIPEKGKGPDMIYGLPASLP